MGMAAGNIGIEALELVHFANRDQFFQCPVDLQRCAHPCVTQIVQNCVGTHGCVTPFQLLKDKALVAGEARLAFLTFVLDFTI